MDVVLFERNCISFHASHVELLEMWKNTPVCLASKQIALFHVCNTTMEAMQVSI